MAAACELASKYSSYVRREGWREGGGEGNGGTKRCHHLCRLICQHDKQITSENEKTIWRIWGAGEGGDLPNHLHKRLVLHRALILYLLNMWSIPPPDPPPPPPLKHVFCPPLLATPADTGPAEGCRCPPFCLGRGLPSRGVTSGGCAGKQSILHCTRATSTPWWTESLPLLRSTWLINSR